MELIAFGKASVKIRQAVRVAGTRAQLSKRGSASQGPSSHVDLSALAGLHTTGITTAMTQAAMTTDLRKHWPTEGLFPHVAYAAVARPHLFVRPLPCFNSLISTALFQPPPSTANQSLVSPLYPSPRSPPPALASTSPPLLPPSCFAVPHHQRGNDGGKGCRGAGAGAQTRQAARGAAGGAGTGARNGAAAAAPGGPHVWRGRCHGRA
eukprot:349973-Chlamydomonas_euryale.AAC.1